jgi:hypothetical protein
VTSRLVEEWFDALSVLTNWNEITLMLVPGFCGIPGSEKADELEWQGATLPLFGPEPALGMPMFVTREAVKVLD